MNRRAFLRTSTAVGAALSTFHIGGTKATGKVLGANDRIRVGVAGINGRGRAHIDAFTGLDNVEVAYLIDPDRSLFESRRRRVEERGGNRPRCVTDIRTALADKELDAISIATCNHWHALMTVWACQAGKDVYVEKPMSHNVFEGRKAVEAARKYRRIVQHGTQHRSDPLRAREIEAVRSGRYGELEVAKGYCCKPRWSIGVAKPEAPPSHLDFDMWLGPAPWQSYHGNLVHYNWHWFWDTGNGDIGNQGVHEMDMARRAIGETLPTRVWSLGGRYGYYDQGETPNTQMAVMDYGQKMLVFEVRGLVEGDSRQGRKIGNEYFTDRGMIADGKFFPKGGGDPEPLDDAGDGGDPVEHFRNFIKAMRSRRQSDLNAEILEGHFSSALCHLANISYRLGRHVPFRSVGRHENEVEVIRRTYEALEENLSRGVGLDVEALGCQLGPALAFDPYTEAFVGEHAANANCLLSRPYRQPYVVPDRV